MRKRTIAVLSGIVCTAALLASGGTTFAYWEKQANTQITQAAPGWQLNGWSQTSQVGEARIYKPNADFQAPNGLIEAVKNKQTANFMIPLDAIFKGAFQARYTVNGDERYYSTGNGSFRISFWTPNGDTRCTTQSSTINFLTWNDNPFGEQVYPTYICARVSGFYGTPEITALDWNKAGLSISGGFYQEFWNNAGAAPKR